MCPPQNIRGKERANGKRKMCSYSFFKKETSEYQINYMTRVAASRVQEVVENSK